VVDPRFATVAAVRQWRGEVSGTVAAGSVPNVRPQIRAPLFASLAWRLSSAVQARCAISANL
jgi:hypothetical protein